MARVYDVAAYILRKQGDLTAMKLQKLCYYSHAWHLVWEEQPLFDSKIEAWANGPVVRDLYSAHRGNFRIAELPEWAHADPDALEDFEVTSIDAVLDFYGGMSAHELSQLTHSEAPWLEARGSTPTGVRSSVEITDEQMATYYDGLTTAATASS